MRFDKLTLKAQNAIEIAQAVASRFQQTNMEPETLLLALLEQPEGLARPILEKVGANPNLLTRDADAELAGTPKVQGATANYGGSI
jgi:ATP-dependent Clp protease ATP-binding subunit ClpB